MNGQTYLYLLKDEIGASINPANYWSMMQKLPKHMVRGDSLDVPYLNAIRCHEFSQEIGKGDVADGGVGDLTGVFKQDPPVDGSVSFQKSLDSASPQLWYGCYKAEVFPYATFFFRRKTSFGYAGVVHPHTVITFKNCEVDQWETDGNTETVEMAYEAMAMVSFLQFADTPLPQGISGRYFDLVNGTGDTITSSLAKYTIGFAAMLFAVGVTTAAGMTHGGAIPCHFRD